MRKTAALLVLCAAWGTTRAQNAPAPQHDANFDAEVKKADDLFNKGSRLQAEPLYADLCRQDPSNGVFAERHASGLIAEADIEDDATKRQKLHDEANAEFRRASKLGNNSLDVKKMLGDGAGA